MRRLSVVVPSYASWRTIERTLEGLRAQSPVRAAEVLIADSSSDGPTLEALRRAESAGARVIRLPERSAPAAARNAGARAASGDLLVFVDSDAVPEADWLSRISEAHDAGCRAGGGSVLLPEEQRWDALAAAQYYLQFNEFMPYGPRREVRFTPSCNLFCERSLFEQAGGFPAIRAAEDVLFGLRVGRLAPFWFVPQARVRHVFREQWGSFLSNQALLGRYVLVYRRMEEGRFYYRGLWPALFLPAFLLIKLARILVRVVRSSPREAARFVVCLPVFLLGLAAWSLGFLQGMYAVEEA